MTAVETVTRWCRRCDSPAREEQVRGVAGKWWRWVCTGCGMTGAQHSEREHRRHVQQQRRQAERTRREVPASALWHLDRDERGD